MLKKSGMIGLALAITLLTVSSATAANIKFSHAGRPITDLIPKIPSANATNIKFYGGDMIGYTDLRQSQGLIPDDKGRLVAAFQILRGRMGIDITPSHSVVTGDGFLKRDLGGVVRSTGFMKQVFASEGAGSGISTIGPWETTIVTESSGDATWSGPTVVTSGYCGSYSGPGGAPYDSFMKELLAP